MRRSSRPKSAERPRGSLKPSARRSTSEPRNSGGMVNVIQRGLSPACGAKQSLGGIFRSKRGSFLENKRGGKDPRPLTEKTYQSKCISSLVEFLRQNNFPFSADERKLMFPSKKDVERIFEFLYRFWEPTYNVGRIEEDAPKILKMLNYPFMVTKSTFLSVTRVTWSNLLGILMWLLELSKCAMNLDISSYFQNGDFDNGEEHFKLLNYVLENFRRDPDPDQDRKFFSSLITNRCTVDRSIEELQEELHAQNEKLAQVQSEESVLKQYEMDNEVLAVNIVKYDNFLAQMKKRREVKEQECLELDEKYKQKKIELQQLVEATEEKEKAYNQQGYDGQQKQQFLLAQKQNLSKELEEKSERLSKEEKTYWDLQIENSTLLAKVLVMTQEFNEKYASLESTVKDAITSLKKVDIPSVTKACHSFEVNLPQFEIGQSSRVADFLTLKGEIIPALDGLKDCLMNQKDLVNDIKAVNDNCVHELGMKLSELKIKRDLIKAQSMQKRRERDRKAEEFKQEILQLQKEMDSSVARLEEKQKYCKKLEKQITSLKQIVASKNAMMQESHTMHASYRKKAKEMFQKMTSDVKDQKAKCDELHSLIRKQRTDLHAEAGKC